MYYKVSIPDRTSTPSPTPLRRLSQYHVPNTYFQSVKQPQERQFEPIERQRTLVDLNEIALKDQEIYRLNKLVDQLQEDKQKLRNTVEQQSIFCANKEQEIQQLISKQYSIYREQTQQISTLRIQLEQHINENTRILDYVKELSQEYQNMQKLYQDAFIELQKANIYENIVNLQQEELKGKQEEINILKNELQISTKVNTEQNENQQIFDFLNQIKQQYFDHEKSECESLFSIKKEPIYSFQTSDEQ